MLDVIISLREWREEGMFSVLFSLRSRFISTGIYVGRYLSDIDLFLLTVIIGIIASDGPV